MLKEYYSLKKMNGFVLHDKDGATGIGAGGFAKSFLIELANLGYILDEDAFYFLKGNDSIRNRQICLNVLEAARKIKGADVKYEPMYPNFPQQVAEASDMELYLNAIVHYWFSGKWLPNYETAPRSKLIEHTDFTTLSLKDDVAFYSVFLSIICSNNSISGEDKEIVEWFFDQGIVAGVPADIPFKENMCLVAGKYLELGIPINDFVSEVTDVLRVLTYLSGGDVSLAANTKFKSLPRRKRRLIIQALDSVVAAKANTLEDFNRHRSKWVRAFHSLHVGEYSPRLRELATKIRSGDTIPTWNTDVEKMLSENSSDDISNKLKERPSEFARRLDHVLRTANPHNKLKTVNDFGEVASSVSTRVLTQVYGNFKGRLAGETTRVVFPKGDSQRVIQLSEDRPGIWNNVSAKVIRTVGETLRDRFAASPDLGNVYVDEALKKCPLPAQMRSASTSAYSVARGTHLPLGNADDKRNTLRFFIYWVGEDIDLSASFHDEDFNLVNQVSYTNLREGKCYHSGDITWARNGASEFIDIDMDHARGQGHRYVAMNVYVYSGPHFAAHETCYAGWMLRERPNSGEVYEPSTVQNKLDLQGRGRMCIPVVFDLETREVISTDLYTKGHDFNGGINIHSNGVQVSDILKSIAKTPTNRMSLYDLARIHVAGRGKELVDNREDADTVFGLEQDDDFNPYKVNLINEELLA